MENEMLNKILEEINKVNNKVDSLKVEMNKKFEEMDNKFEGLNNKFEGLNNKFEGLNAEVKEIKIELKQLRKDFESHDQGEKMVWEEFENNIGEELEKIEERVEGNSIHLLYIKNAVRKLLNIHKKELNLAEESEKYETNTNEN